MDFEKGYHYRASLHDLIPSEIRQSYSKDAHPLVFGCVREMENDFIIPTIPFYLTQLIWKYFPSFV